MASAEDRGTYLEALIQRGIRSKKWSSKEAFAEQVGKNPSTIYRYISGTTDLADAESLPKMAEILEVSVEDLIAAGKPETPNGSGPSYVDGLQEGKEMAVLEVEGMLSGLRDRLGLPGGEDAPRGADIVGEMDEASDPDEPEEDVG